MQGNDEENEENKNSGGSALDTVSDGIKGAKKLKKAHDDAEADAAAKKAQQAQTAAAQHGTDAAQKAAAAGTTTGGAAADMAQRGAEAGEKIAEAGEKAAEAAGQTAGKAGEAAASAGAGAATMGISLIVQAVIEAIKGTGSAMSDLLTGEDSGFSIGKLIGIPIVSIIFLTYMFSFYATTNSSGEVENYQEVEYARDVTEELSERNTTYKEDEELSEEVNVDQPYLNALLEYKSQTDEAIKTAFMERAVDIVASMHPDAGTKIKNFFQKLLHFAGSEYTYDEDSTVSSFYDNPYPYSLKINESEYYRIGDYLKTNGFDGVFVNRHDVSDYNIIPEEYINNDLNYIEFNNVISQGPNYETYDSKHRVYLDMFQTAEAQEKLFEMTIENPAGDVAPTYYGYIVVGYNNITDEYGNTYPDPIEERTPDYSQQGEGLLSDSRCHRKYYYYNIVVKPYGLRELYCIANKTDETGYIMTSDDEMPGSEVYSNHPGGGDEEGKIEPILNYEMLDRNELYDRVFLRADREDSLVAEDEFGPPCDEERSELSLVYNYSTPTIDGSNVVTTGRSGNYYIPLAKLINSADIEFIVNHSHSENEEYFADANVTIHEFNGDESAFLEEIKAMVTADMQNTGILASLTAAQALLESRHGTSGLTKKANNLFGIKGSYNGMSVTMKTREVINGETIYVPAAFRAYNSWEESIANHSALFTNNSRYSNLVGETNYVTAATNVQKDGYATDPNYASSLISIIRAYGLDEWDQEVLNGN